MTRLAATTTRSNVVDADLMERWRAGVDSAAVDQLVRRHGPMVLGVCRRALADPNDADDAFQATFLVFLRKARSLARPGQVAGWLHGVALRVARKVRADSARRRQRESIMIEPAALDLPEDNRELYRILDEELNRLPAKYRLPIVLCELEGRTLEGTGRMLGWPKGTVAGRLSRGREMLRHRLSKRRGVALPLFLVGVVGTSAAQAAPPEPLVTATVAAASGQRPPPPRPAAIARAILSGDRWRFALLIALLLTVPVIGAVAWRVHAGVNNVDPVVETGAAPSGAAGGCHSAP